jgi:hypothetical protein
MLQKKKSMKKVNYSFFPKPYLVSIQKLIPKISRLGSPGRAPAGLKIRKF